MDNTLSPSTRKWLSVVYIIGGFLLSTFILANYISQFLGFIVAGIPALFLAIFYVGYTYIIARRISDEVFPLSLLKYIWLLLFINLTIIFFIRIR